MLGCLITQAREILFARLLPTLPRSCWSLPLLFSLCFLYFCDGIAESLFVLVLFLLQGAKVFYLSGLVHGHYPKMEVHNLGRFISVMKFRPLQWRSTHPYILSDRYRVAASRNFMQAVSVKHTHPSISCSVFDSQCTKPTFDPCSLQKLFWKNSMNGLPGHRTFSETQSF